jgi:hypothetical protein
LSELSISAGREAVVLMGSDVAITSNKRVHESYHTVVSIQILEKQLIEAHLEGESP